MDGRGVEEGGKNDDLSSASVRLENVDFLYQKGTHTVSAQLEKYGASAYYYTEPCTYICVLQVINEIIRRCSRNRENFTHRTRATKYAYVGCAFYEFFFFAAHPPREKNREKYF